MFFVLFAFSAVIKFRAFGKKVDSVPLGWSQYVSLLTIDSPDEHRFYEIEATANPWSVRELERHLERETGLPGEGFQIRLLPMVTLAEIESLVFKLPESDRARLAADLLDSLPGVLIEEDEGLAEALRRSEEMDRDPSVCLTHEEFLKAVRHPE